MKLLKKCGRPSWFSFIWFHTVLILAKLKSVPGLNYRGGGTKQTRGVAYHAKAVAIHASAR